MLIERPFDSDMSNTYVRCYRNIDDHVRAQMDVTSHAHAHTHRNDVAAFDLLAKRLTAVYLLPKIIVLFTK